MKVEKIDSYPPLTIDEQETVLTWDALDIESSTASHDRQMMRSRLLRRDW